MSGDAPSAPTTVQVASEGDDANDGLVSPVRTLKRALGVAAASSQITSITLGPGRYAASSGETFPYALQDNLTISGPAGGGAILVGTAAEPGLVIAAGTLQDLEFETFSVAITVTGAVELSNVRVRTSGVAVRGESTASIQAQRFDIAGVAGACATGIELNGSAELTLVGVSSRALGTTLLATDQTTVDVKDVSLMGDPTCLGNLIHVSSSASFTMSDGLLDEGNSGVLLNTPTLAPALTARLTNIVIRNMKSQALGVGRATVQVSGGELSRTLNNTSLNVSNGSAVLTNVALLNSSVGIFTTDALLTMRGCNISGNGVGIALSYGTVADLGTRTNHGNNTIRNSSLGIALEAGTGVVPAVGNTWNPVQGANLQGRYNVGTIVPGPIESVAGNNFQIQVPNLSLEL